MQTILVPLDESTASEAVLPVAAAFARATSTSLLLVRVPDRPPLGVRPFEVRGGAVAYAEEYLAQRADLLIEQGVTVKSTTLPEGPVAGALLQAVNEREAGMVAMATHGRTGPGTSPFGSVTNAVLARCPVPVLIARSWLDGHGAASIEREALVLCATDGARPVAEQLAAALGGRVHVGDPSAAIELGAGIIVMAAHGEGTAVVGNAAEEVLRSGTVPLVLVGPAAL
jgi:nucleotide-binding universal stress UspA family protein